MGYLEHGGTKLYYELHGTGNEPSRQPILMIQGIGVVGMGWSPQVDELSKNHQILVFDNRGIGKSTFPKGQALTIEQMVDDAKALIEHVGWRSCHVIGHSMGGIIAQRLAIAHPKLVRSLTLMCTVSCGADATRLTPRMFLLGLRTRIGTKAMRRSAFMELIYPKKYFSQIQYRAAHAEQLASIFGRDLANSPPILMKQMMALRKHDCTNELSQLQSIPSLVISATHDPIAPPRFGKKLNSLIAGSRFIEITDASHAVPIQKSDEINRIIEEFISSQGY